MSSSSPAPSRGRCALPAAAARRRRRPAAVGPTRAAFGFQLSDPSAAEGSPAAAVTERFAASLLTAASSLLLYGPLLTAEPAKSFLAVLTAVSRGDGGGALAAHAAFARRLQPRSGAACPWALALAEAVIASDNAFSVAAASSEEAAVPPHLLAAAASDLAALQLLAGCGPAGLAAWAVAACSEGRARGANAASLPPALAARWLAATDALMIAPPPPPPSAASDDEADGDDGGWPALPPAGEWVGPPALPAARRAAAAALAAAPDWAAERPLRRLAAFHAAHGVGAAASAAGLTWEGGRLEPWAGAPAAAAADAADAWSTPSGAPPAPPQPPPPRPRGRPLLFGGPGGAQAARSWAAARCCCGGGGGGPAALPPARLVRVPRPELRSLGQLLSKLGESRRARFVVLLEDVCVLPFGEPHAELLRALPRLAGGGGGDGGVEAVASARAGLLRPGGGDAAAEGGALAECFGDAAGDPACGWLLRPGGGGWAAGAAGA